MNENTHFVAITSQRFINTIIYHFINQMVQPSGRRTANVHPGTATDSFQSFENLNLLCPIISVYGSIFFIYQFISVLPRAQFFCTVLKGSVVKRVKDKHGYAPSTKGFSLFQSEK